MKKLLFSISLLLLASSGKAQFSSCTYSGMLIASGTAGPVGDDNTLDATIPFSFVFSGTSYTNARISTNGFIWLGTTGGAGCCNGFLIPSDVNIVAPFIALTQTDWLPTIPANGTIFYGVVGTAPNRIFVIHYDNLKHISSTDRMTGEIQLYETTNEVRLVMSSLTGFASGYTGTMGVAQGDGVHGFAVSGRNQASSYSASNECFALSVASLPVSMLRFDARKSGQTAEISWATGVEQSNDFFAVERSHDGSEFVRIATVNSKGNTAFGHQYAVTDKYPAAGTNLYRLAQYDLDGKATYFGTRTVSFDKADRTSVEPNPFVNQLNIRVPAGTSQTTEITVSDMYGKKVAQLIAQGTEQGKLITLPSDDWASGCYTVTVHHDGVTEHYKVTKH